MEWSRWIRSAAVASLWGAGAFYGVILALTLLAGGTSWSGQLREALWAVPLYLNVAGWGGLPAFLAVGTCLAGAGAAWGYHRSYFSTA